MDKVEKAKLKVLIKSILINKYPKGLTAKQLSDIINTYEWGFNTPITSRTIAKLLFMELGKHDKNFMDNIISKKNRSSTIYSISTLK